MSLENVIHEEVLGWKQFGLFKLTMVSSFADACFNAYECLVAEDVNTSRRDHTFFAIVVEDLYRDEKKITVQFNYRIDIDMKVSLVSLTCKQDGWVKPFFCSSVALLPSYASIIASIHESPVVGTYKNNSL